MANNEKGLYCLSLISGLASATLQGWLLQEIWIRAHLPRQINGMCLQSSLKHFFFFFGGGFKHTSSHQGSSPWSCSEFQAPPVSPYTHVTLGQQVTSWRLTICLYCPFRPPAMRPVQGLSPPFAVCLETSFEKQPGGAGGTFFSATALIQNVPFYTKGGNGDSLHGENCR